MGNDLEFTFNATPFTNAIQKIAQALNFVEDKFKSATNGMNLFTKKTTDDSKKRTETIKDTSVNFGKQMGSALTGLIAKVGALGAAYMGIKALLARMPEVGQTFSIAGDILMKNFVWPLRQELLPYLQKILNWARDNRTTMLQWGQVLVNIFRAIVQVAKTIIDALKPIFDVFKNIIKKMFGDTVKTISDVLNILIFKATVIVLFLVEIFKPIMIAIAKIINMIYEIGDALAKGILDGFNNVFGTWTEVISDIIKSFQDLMRAIAGIGESDIWQPILTIFKFIGQVIGVTLKLILSSMSNFMKRITLMISNDFVKQGIATVKSFILFIQSIPDSLEIIVNKIKNFFIGISDGIKDFFKSISKMGDNKLWEPILSIFKFVGLIINNTIKLAFKAVTDIIKILTSIFSWDIKKAPKWAQTIMSAIRELPQAIENMKNKILGFFTGIGDSITAFFDELEKTIIDSIKSFTEKIKKAADYLTDFVPGMKDAKKIIKIIEEKTKGTKSGIDGKGWMQDIKPLIDLKGIKTGSNTTIKNDLTFGDIKISANSELEGRAGAKGFIDEVSKSIFNGLRFDMNQYQATRG